MVPVHTRLVHSASPNVEVVTRTCRNLVKEDPRLCFQPRLKTLLDTLAYITSSSMYSVEKYISSAHCVDHYPPSVSKHTCHTSCSFEKPLSSAHCVGHYSPSASKHPCHFARSVAIQTQLHDKLNKNKHPPLASRKQLQLRIKDSLPHIECAAWVELPVPDDVRLSQRSYAQMSAMKQNYVQPAFLQRSTYATCDLSVHDDVKTTRTRMDSAFVYHDDV